MVTPKINKRGLLPWRTTTNPLFGDIHMNLSQSTFVYCIKIEIIKLLGENDLFMNNESTCFKVSTIYGGICVPIYKPNINEILKTNATAKILQKKCIP